jgi:acyl-CoA thioester hydrolase
VAEAEQSVVSAVGKINLHKDDTRAVSLEPHGLGRVLDPQEFEPDPTRLAVRWSDRDPLGHVNFAVFLTYLEEGRNAWLAAELGQGFDPEQYVVARVELDYRAEIPAGTAFVETHHTVIAVGRSSVTFDESLCIANSVIVAEGRVVLVMWDPGSHCSRDLTTEEHDSLIVAPR